MIVTVTVRGAFDSHELPRPVYTVAVNPTTLPINITYPPIIAVTCDSNLKDGYTYRVDMPSPIGCQYCYERNLYPVITLLQGGDNEV